MSAAADAFSLDPRDGARVRDMARRLDLAPFSTPADDSGVAPRWLADELRDLLGLEKACAYRPARGPGGVWTLGERVSASEPGFFERYDAAIARTPFPFFYDPLRPERHQRDRVRLRTDLCAHGPGEPCAVEEMWRGLGIGQHDQIRVLVSRGPLLLAWVGGFRAEPFGARDVAVLQALVPALRRSLRARRMLLDARSAVDASLDAIVAALSAPAFLVGPAGDVRHANAVGAAMLERSRVEVQARLREALAGRGPSAVARLTSPAVTLVILREEATAFEARFAAMMQRWGVTSREADVLRWVVVGDSNKEIALRLKCCEGTVERHVTTLLRKARCDGRSRLVARFWTG